MKLRKNDEIKIVRGKDAGKSGKVERVFSKEQNVAVVTILVAPALLDRRVKLATALVILLSVWAAWFAGLRAWYSAMPGLPHDGTFFGMPLAPTLKAIVIGPH